MKTALIAIVLGLIGFELTLGVHRVVKTRVRALEVLVGLRPRHFLLAVPTLIAVIAAAILLIQIPGFSWGWWRTLGGSGNVIFGANDDPRFMFVPFVFIAALIVAMPVFVESEERAYRLDAENWSTGQRVRRAIRFGLIHLVAGIPIAAALAISIMGGYYTWAYLRAFRQSMRDYRRVDSEKTITISDGGNGVLTFKTGSGSDADDLVHSWAAEDRAQEAGLLESTRGHLAYNYVAVTVAAVLIWGFE